MLKYVWIAIHSLLLFLILNSSHWSYSVEKSVLKKFTRRHLHWRLFLLKLQAWGPAAQVFFTEFATFLRIFIFKNNCIFIYSIFIYSAWKTANEVSLKVQPCKLCNNKNMIASTPIINNGIFPFIAVLVLKLSSRKVLFINRKNNKNC